MRKKKIKSLHISARRWFSKAYGNTYHSVQVYVNDDVIQSGIHYGYGDHFFQTAARLLNNAGYDLKDTWLTSYHLREVLKGTYSVTDVGRKKDL